MLWCSFISISCGSLSGDLDGFVRAKRPQRLPGVLTRTEIGKLLAHIHGTHGLMASLLYGTGMRLMDCIRLRVKDIDFAYHQIVVRDGKGQQDRVVPLPQRLGTVKRVHQADLAEGYGAVLQRFARALTTLRNFSPNGTKPATDLQTPP